MWGGWIHRKSFGKAAEKFTVTPRVRDPRKSLVSESGHGLLPRFLDDVRQGVLLKEAAEAVVVVAGQGVVQSCLVASPVARVQDPVGYNS